MPITAASTLVRVSGIEELRRRLAACRDDGVSVGLVPTMGALHEGHLSLVDRARSRAGIVVLSVFVNPLQFSPSEDFLRYPRPIEDDERLARDAGVDVLFTPDAADMYPDLPVVTVSGGSMATRWEGAHRPGHFDGVLTVVAKLFNIVQPDFAVFGQKDLQQAALVKALVRDLNVSVDIDVAPIIREDDGVAMSSRNRYLGAADRVRATALGRALRSARAAFRDGESEVGAIEAAGRRVLDSEPELEVDYFAVVDPSSFEPATVVTEDSAVIVAARVGPTRLIDNCVLAGNDSD